MLHMFVLGGVAQDVPAGFIDDVLKFCVSFRYRINEMETVLTNNAICETEDSWCGGDFFGKCLKLWFYRGCFKVCGKLIGICLVIGNLMMLICKINVPVNVFA